MDGYIIQRIALYVKDAKIVKQLFYIENYRNLIKTSEYHFDELVLLYSNKEWYNWNNLEIMKSFYRLNIPYNHSYKHMDYAAFLGHIEVVKWLHYNRKEGCTKDAMDNAARRGHLEIVKWLHENRKEGCTTYAMDGAAYDGHLEVIKWLHYNRKEGCTRNAMKYAASNGHIEVVKWLNDNIKIDKIFDI